MRQVWSKIFGSQLDRKMYFAYTTACWMTVAFVLVTTHTVALVGEPPPMEYDGPWNVVMVPMFYVSHLVTLGVLAGLLTWCMALRLRDSGRSAWVATCYPTILAVVVLLASMTGHNEYRENPVRLAGHFGTGHLDTLTVWPCTSVDGRHWALATAVSVAFWLWVGALRPKRKNDANTKDGGDPLSRLFGGGLVGDAMAGRWDRVYPRALVLVGAVTIVFAAVRVGGYLEFVPTLFTEPVLMWPIRYSLFCPSWASS